MRDSIGDKPISGLRWNERYYQDNGEDSFVIPFPTTRPAHIVFHGSMPFNHGHYGYHLGIEDNLTFLGSSWQEIHGHFVDCRKNSSTLGQRCMFTFRPNSRRTLVIPPGVAHTFEGLENIYTINSYKMYLPDPSKLMTDENPWFTGADITNFSIDAADSDIPIAEPNPFPTSDTFYDLLRQLQLHTADKVDYEYPFTEDVTFEDGRNFRLEIKKRIEAIADIPETKPASKIEGVIWRRHHTVWGDSTAGYSALLDPAPFQVIDHGERKYDNDAYGIHLTSEDRLTFLGHRDQIVAVRLLDCRIGSPTFQEEQEVYFSPSPLRYLCIPAGVAHGFRHLENVFTINRPRRCAGDLSLYEPGNDVIDWHFDDYPAPGFEIEEVEVPIDYYKELARRQRMYIDKDDRQSTAMVFLASNEQGRHVRIALRKKE